MERRCFAKLLCLLTILYSIIYRVECRSSGAPSEACATLSPNPTAHGAQPNTGPVPYIIDLSDFDEGDNVLEYQPGATYQSNYYIACIACCMLEL